MKVNVDIIIKVIIPILGAIITYMIVPFIMKKTSKEQRDEIVAWVKIAVRAAEQMQEAGLIDIPKKAYVLDFINKKGFDITLKELDMLIEAAVKELNMLQTKTLD